MAAQKWRQIRALVGKHPRRAAIHDLYLRQLGSAAKFVRSFETRNDKDVTDYFLFFATSSRTGLKKMKEPEPRTSNGVACRQSARRSRNRRYAPLTLQQRASLVQSDREECGLGDEDNVGGYGGCESNCQLGPYCGDGVIDLPTETCDDGNRLERGGCSSRCNDQIR